MDVNPQAPGAPTSAASPPTNGETPPHAPLKPAYEETAWGRWLTHGGTPEEASHIHDQSRPWYQVLWLTGVDYFSTLGYQPGIALIAAGALSPLATLILVLFTLFGALPVYREVAARSFIGQGSIAMLERLLSGWRSKAVVLLIIGFASTAFVVTVTLSAADAAKHLIENPFLEPYLRGGQVWVTLVLLALLTGVFLRGFSEAIGLAVAVGLPYILLNVLVVGRAFVEVFQHPEHLQNWSAAVTARGDWTMVLLLALLAFPKLALGLSGFETGIAVMPLVKGEPADAHAPVPHGRIRNSRKLLTAAALIMSGLLIGSSFVSAVLVPEEAYRDGGPAAGRVLAYLTHHLFGNAIGTIYDASTILILWFAGASAITGMLNLVPRYLPRLGMAPRWVAYARPLVLVLFAAEVLVTLAFRAQVEAQGGAYATGVLVLMLSGSIAVALALGREGMRWKSLYFWLVTAGFVYAVVENVRVHPDGVIIAGLFILFIVVLSVLSRYGRATEMRVQSYDLVDDQSRELWERLAGKRVNLAPLKNCSREDIRRKTEEIRRHYKVTGPLAFLHVYLRDDRSDFSSELHIKVEPCGEEDYYIEVTGAVAIANTIAFVSELIDPISISLGLTRRSSVAQAFAYLLWGEGETGIKVYDILRRHWDATPEDDIRPLIYLMSE
jgi:hypothetical protein